MSAPGLDPTFSDLPHRRLGDVALARAQELGATHADFRLERLRYQYLGARDGILQTASDAEDLGFAVRVVHGGAWGFASGVVLTDDEARRVAETAVAVAQVAAAMTTTPVELAPEPVHDDVTWVSGYDVNPLEVPTRDKAALLADWTERLRAGAAVAHATAFLQQVQENKYYADLSGTRTTQQRVRLQPGLRGHRRGRRDRHLRLHGVDRPAGRPRLGVPHRRALGLGRRARRGARAARREAQGAQRRGRAPTTSSSHPSNLWLTIHESIGHATELDRALGYEANYAGTSFATYDKLGTLQYGSAIMNVQGDRTQEHGLATVGYDDEGVQTQSWDIVRDGVLVGYQLDRSMGHLKPELNDGRSNGCAYADSSGHIPIQRMANVSLHARHRRTCPPTTSSVGSSAASTSSATSRGPSTCSASTSSSPASGSTRSPTAGSTACSATSPTRRPPPTSGAPWRPSAAPRPGCSAARSTAARPSPARWPPSATAARPSLFRGVNILNTIDEAGH